MSTDRASTQLDSRVIKNGTSGQLIARVNPVKNTSLYEARIKGPTGDWITSVFAGNSKHIAFDRAPLPP